MTDDLSPTPDEPELTLKQAARLVGLSTKTLGQRLQRGQVRGRLARPRANQPRQWLTTRSALADAELLEPEAALAPTRDFLPEPLMRNETLAEALLERLDGFLEALREDAKVAGSAGTLAELLAQERQQTGMLAQKVAELQADRDRLTAELAAERTRAVRFGEWFWGRGRGDRL